MSSGVGLQTWIFPLVTGMMLVVITFREGRAKVYIVMP